MSDLLKTLNRDQLDAAIQIHGALLVVAGAGTGKTRVITLRIAHMIRSGIRPEQIVGLSFTNKAAREMQERLAALIGPTAANKVTLSTFHSFALGILKEFPTLAGLRSGFSIIDEPDAFALLRDAVQEAGVSDFFPVQYFKEKIAGLKDAMLLPSDVAKRRGFVDGIIVSQVFDAYTRRLRLYNLVDFDDLVYLSWRVLNESPNVVSVLRKRWSHFLVDEFQDTSQGQFEFLRTLLSASANICAVGDDDQSIYSWRGANPKVLRLFLETFENARRVTLDQNYRCTPVILEAANSVIKLNSDRLEKQLWCTSNETERIRIYAADSAAEEALFVAETTKNLLLRGAKASQVAVLYRSNVLSGPLEAAFMGLGIPFHISGATQMSDRKEIRDLMSLVSFLANQSDLRSFFRAAEVFGFKMGLRSQEQFSHLFMQETLLENQGLAGVSKVHVFQKIIHEVAPELSKVYSEILEVGAKFESCSSFVDMANLFEEWFDRSSYRSRFRAEASSMLQVLKREEFVRRFFSVIRNLSSDEQPEDCRKGALIRQLAERFGQKIQQTNENEHSDKVQLLTIHASKGLEFEHVFLVGLEEGILPHERSLEEGSEQEERRLMYVAMTRAKNKLYLSHALFRHSNKPAKNGKRNGNSSRCRYINDIPDHLLEDDHVRLQSAEAKRVEAARKLFDMFR